VPKLDTFRCEGKEKQLGHGLGRILGEVIVTLYKVLYRNLNVSTEENCSLYHYIESIGRNTKAGLPSTNNTEPNTLL